MIGNLSRSMGVTLLLATAGCVPKNDSSQTVQNAGGPRLVVAQCAVPQGNGGNWGATLGWISEQILVRAEQAERLGQKAGRAPGLHLGCMLGGSSASVVTNLTMRILQNRNLVPDAHPDRIFTPDEARLLARAIRYVALAADLNLREWVRFLGQVVVLNGERLVSRTHLGKLIGEIFGGDRPDWWDGQQVEGKYMLVDFATLLHLAETMTRPMLEMPVEEFLRGAHLELAKGHGMKSISDFVRFQGLADVPRANPTAEALSEILKTQSDVAGAQADAFIASHFRLGEYKRRHGINVFRDGPADYPLKVTLDRPLSPGFCTTTMAALYPSPALVPRDAAPDYKALRPVVFCSREMAEKLLGSPLYRKHIQEGHPFASRFVIATVSTSRGSLSPSIREPGLMRELAGAANEGELEVEEIYAPELDKEAHGQPRFALFPAAGFDVAGRRFRPTLAVAGGFADRRISAWMLTYYGLMKMDELAAQGHEVVGRFGIFGKPDKRAVDKFDTSSIRTLFSSTPQAGEENVRDWFAFQDAWCDTFGPELERRKARITTVAFNWDVHKIPAAQSGASRLVAVKGANAARLQLGLYEKEVFPGLAFDPLVDTDHVPQLTEGYSCKP